MDTNRFDDLTRLVAHGISRRSLHRWIAGGLLSFKFGRLTASAQQGCDSEGSPCQLLNTNCCHSLLCENDVCVPQVDCPVIGESCGGIGGPYCCRGLSCRIDTLVCYLPENCLPGSGDYCDEQEPCCDGMTCVVDTCTWLCVGEGQFCGEVEGGDFVECCDGFDCTAFKCLPSLPECAPVDGACASIDDCCDGLDCIEGTCAEAIPPCTAEGDPCASDEECCDGICCAGACRAIECCIDEPDPNARCADGTSCFEGICESVEESCLSDSDCAAGTCCCAGGGCSADCCESIVTPTVTPIAEPTEAPVAELPNTGVGSAGRTSKTWLGAGLIGAAATLIGARKINPAADESVSK